MKTIFPLTLTELFVFDLERGGPPRLLIESHAMEDQAVNQLQHSFNEIEMLDAAGKVVAT